MLEQPLPVPGELWLVRDPAGVKPLYVGRQRDGWWFASELGAARACGLVQSELRPEALEEFLVYRFIPSPGTPFRHAWKLPPSHFCRLPLAQLPGEPTFVRFDAHFAPAVVPETGAEWDEALRAALVEAIRRQLMSDVPVGSLLSGGVDSTAVTRVMRDHLPMPPQAFAVGFADDQAGRELTAARRAAAALGVPLTEVAVTADEYLEAWRERVAGLGEPIADSSSVLVALVCRAIRRTHKVVLTGQGADEPLGGYPRHAAERLYPMARALGPLLRFLPERLAASDRVARVRRGPRGARRLRPVRRTGSLRRGVPGRAESRRSRRWMRRRSALRRDLRARAALVSFARAGPRAIRAAPPPHRRACRPRRAHRPTGRPGDRGACAPRPAR